MRAGYYDLGLPGHGLPISVYAKPPLLQAVSRLRSGPWRTSIGRWEVSDTVQADREWWGPGGFSLGYIRGVVSLIKSLGHSPLVSLDHMPAALALHGDVQAYPPPWPPYTWANGIRNSPPHDLAQYVESVRSLLAAIPEVEWEWGNEPEYSIFWRGMREMFVEVYQRLRKVMPSIGVGSFAISSSVCNWSPGPAFRPPFYSFHVYTNDLAEFQRIVIEGVSQARAQGVTDVRVTEWCGDLANPQAWFDGQAHYEHHRQALTIMERAGVTVSYHSLIVGPGPALIKPDGIPRPVAQLFYR